MVGASIQISTDIGAAKAEGLIDKDRAIHPIEGFTGSGGFGNSVSLEVSCSVVTADKD